VKRAFGFEFRSAQRDFLRLRSIISFARDFVIAASLLALRALRRISDRFPT